jgi:hypothetical protein
MKRRLARPLVLAAVIATASILAATVSAQTAAKPSL